MRFSIIFVMVVFLSVASADDTPAETTVAPVAEPETTVAPVDPEPETTVAPVEQPKTTVAPVEEIEAPVAPVIEPETTLAPEEPPETTVAPEEQPETTVEPVTVEEPETTVEPVDQAETTVAPVEPEETTADHPPKPKPVPRPKPKGDSGVPAPPSRLFGGEPGSLDLNRLLRYYRYRLRQLNKERAEAAKVLARGGPLKSRDAFKSIQEIEEEIGAVSETVNGLANSIEADKDALKRLEVSRINAALREVLPLAQKHLKKYGSGP